MNAQSQTTNYYYTQSSQRYFDNRELDSVFYATAGSVFEENKIPETLFDKKYPKLKPVLVGVSRTGILQSFKWVESTGGASIKAPKGSEKFIANKALYKKYLVKNIRDAFDNNKVLKLYFSFNGNDRITYFKSIVRPLPNGKLKVQELITVYNGDGHTTSAYGEDDYEDLQDAGGMNNEIKRGIVRSFPLYYVNKNSLFQNTTFELKQVLKNGAPENYHTEKGDNGIRLFTGSQNIFLENGTYTYDITYETDHQLKLLKDYDEVYWNVTGNGWSFRIDSASCTFVLPKSFMPLSSRCYTGAQNESKEECNINQEIRGDSVYITYKTTRSLLPYNGFTIATSWPKGFLKKPSALSTAWYFFWNNKGVFFLPLAAVLSIIFLFIFWLKYGIDKKRGNIYPQYAPPPGFSPAALGYIFRQRFSRQLTAATLVDAAVRHVIKIDVEREGWLIKHNEYNIRQPDKPVIKPTSSYEDFEDSIQKLINTSIEKGHYNSGLGKLNTEVEKYCRDNYKSADGIVRDKGFFAVNSSYLTIPVLLIIVAAIWGFFGGIAPVLNFGSGWQIWLFAGGLILCIAVIKIFRRLLPSYNEKGRKLMDQIEGFRMFLSTADVQRFDAMAPPKKTLELYEKYLPFAIALGCDVEWGKQFKEIIDTASIDNAAASSGIYGSHSFGSNSSNFTSSFTSSFSGAISSASTPPSSSSSGGGGGSSFGGGSSGGGGGGGGGGGW